MTEITTVLTAVVLIILLVKTTKILWKMVRWIFAILLRVALLALILTFLLGADVVFDVFQAFSDLIYQLWLDITGLFNPQQPHHEYSERSI